MRGRSPVGSAAATEANRGCGGTAVPELAIAVVRSFMYRVAARPGDVDAGLPVVVWSQPR
jgi:hypothetical protein